MKGRNSSTVTVRISDSVYAILLGMSNGSGLSSYLSKVITKYATRSVHTINKGGKDVNR